MDKRLNMRETIVMGHIEDNGSVTSGYIRDRYGEGHNIVRSTMRSLRSRNLIQLETIRDGDRLAGKRWVKAAS